MKHSRIVVAAALAAALPLAASAQTVGRVPQVTRQVTPFASRAVTPTPKKFHPIKIGPHTFYGKIESLSGKSVVIRTRHQRLVTVDATTVLADGSYSAPLFVGKLVTVDGDQSAGGVFTASHISRLTNLNALPEDR